MDQRLQGAQRLQGVTELIKLLIITISPFMFIFIIDHYKTKNKTVGGQSPIIITEKEIEETVNLIHNLKLKVPID